VSILNSLVTLEELESIGKVKHDSLVLGDCLEAMAFLADESIDMILCDLPYG